MKLWKNRREGTVEIESIPTEWLEWALEVNHVSVAANPQVKRHVENVLNQRRTHKSAGRKFNRVDRIEIVKGLIQTLTDEIDGKRIPFDRWAIQQKIELRRKYESELLVLEQHEGELWTPL